MGLCVKLCFSVTTILAIAMIVIGTVMHIVLFPKIVEEQIDETLVLRNGTDVLERFAKTPSPYYMNFYFFNVSNKDDVNSKGSKAVLQEVGPYIFREQLDREITGWNLLNATILYEEVRTYYFEANKSRGSLQDVVNHVNMASIGFIESSKAGLLSKVSGIPKDELIETTPGALVESHTVDELIFKGFDIRGNLPPIHDDDLMEFVCKLQDNCTFSLYYGKNGTKSNAYEVYTGDVANDPNTTLNTLQESMKRYREIVTYEHERRLKFWYGDTCNALNGTDGTQYPPLLSKKKGIYAFSAEICRSFYMEYERDGSVMGIPIYRYVLPPTVFQAPDKNPDNMCFCQEDGSVPCPFKDGVFSVSKCQNGYPVIGSAPHFYLGAQEYRDMFVGLQPDKDKHETYLDIEPMTGITISGAKRIQISIQVNPNPLVKWLRFVNETTIFPLFWAEETGDIGSENAEKLENEVQIPIKAGKWGIVAVIAVGALLLLIVIIVALRKMSASRKVQESIHEESHVNTLPKSSGFNGISTNKGHYLVKNMTQDADSKSIYI